MLLQQGATLVDISRIVVLPERQRPRGFPTKDLEDSIANLGGGRINEGLLHPIIINQAFELQIGERRLTACRALGHTQILARFAEQLSPIESQIIELTENLKRSDLDWTSIVRATAKVHRLFLERDAEWTMTETAIELGLTVGTISMYLSVERELEDNKRVAEAGTVREAFNVLKRREQRNAGAQLEELLSAPDVVEEPTAQGLTAAQIDAIYVPEEIRDGLREGTRLRVVSERPKAAPSAPESILHESFLDWAPKYSGEKFNLVHCDFPYGVGLGAGPQGRGSDESIYTDTPELYLALLECFCANLDRFMSVSAHLMFWTSASSDNITSTLAFFRKRAPSLLFHKFPLIWGKSDNAGISSDPRMGPRHTYEACLLASRSSRQIVQVKADYYQSPSERLLHPSTKPEPMLREFMRMLVDESTSLFDPTCGSGSALRAAESLGAKRVLGLEADKAYLASARTALRLSRSKAAVAKSLTLPSSLSY